MSKKIKMRPSDGAKLVEMTRASGYVMARIPRCMPFTIWAKDFDAMPDWTPEEQQRRDYWENTMRGIASRPVRD